LYSIEATAPRATVSLPAHDKRRETQQGKSMARSFDHRLSALAIGLLWIAPARSAGRHQASWSINCNGPDYGALLGAVGLLLIWQGKR
jgi:hypothetical protein